MAEERFGQKKMGRKHYDKDILGMFKEWGTTGTGAMWTVGIVGDEERKGWIESKSLLQLAASNMAPGIPQFLGFMPCAVPFTSVWDGSS